MWQGVAYVEEAAKKAGENPAVFLRRKVNKTICIATILTLIYSHI